MPRLFVAVWPPAEVVAEIEALPRSDEPGVRWVPPASWHVTLRFLGNAEVDDAEASLRQLSPSADRVIAQLGPAVSRLGRNVICVPCSGLDDLAARVVAATGSIGRPPEPRPFAGHLTLARLVNRGACRLAGHRISVSFSVDEVTLALSEGGPGGPRYTVIDRIPIVEGP